MDVAEEAAAKRLVGLELEGGWKVVDFVRKSGGQTGGHFSQGYVAHRDDGATAFLKAMDFSEAARADDFARAIESIARQFNFERDVLALCEGKRMRNVVRAVGGGVVDLGSRGNPLDRVQYFLFEPAEGDIRKIIDSYDEITLAWAVKVLHEAAVGMRQLHVGQIAHQDFKPSNILAFNVPDVVKVGDLGCASLRDSSCPRDVMTIPGQISYAPPEQLYGYVHQDWVVRRVGSDMYQLGGICVFLLAGLPINAFLKEELSSEYQWGEWQGTYDEVLPHLKGAFGRVVFTLERTFSGPVLDGLVAIVKELCEPDLRTRGDPRRRRRGEQQYSVEPYVSRLGGLRRAAEATVLRKLQR